MSDDAPFKDWLTTTDAAKLMECSRNCILQMVRRGKLPNSIKVGNAIMIPISDLNSFREARERMRSKDNTVFVPPQRDLGL